MRALIGVTDTICALNTMDSFCGDILLQRLFGYAPFQRTKATVTIVSGCFIAMVTESGGSPTPASFLPI